MSKFSEELAKRQRAQQATHTGPGIGESMDPYVAGEHSPFTEAVGYGMKRGLTGLGNLAIRGARVAGVNFGNPLAPVEGAGPLSDSARRMDKEMYREGGLNRQPFAGLGTLVGESITVPGAARGTTVASQAPGMLARTLGARAVPRAAEGAVAAAQFADPEELSTATPGGAVLSMALGRMGDAGGRVMRGLVKKSPEAEQLELMLRNADAETHLPISLSYDKSDLPSKIIGGGYKNASPFFPLAGDILEDQRKQGLNSVRLAGYREAAPGNFTISPDDLANPDLLQKKIKDEFDRLYKDSVKDYAFNVPSDYLQQMEGLIVKADPKINKTSLRKVLGDVDLEMAKFSDGSGVIDGQNLLYYKQSLGRMLKGAPPEERGALKAALGWVDQHIADELKVGNVPQNLADLETYEKLSPAWRSFRAVVDSAKKAKGGEFSPAQFARKAKPLTPERALAQLSDKVLGESATRFTPAGRALAGAMTLGAGIGLGTGAVGAAGFTGAGLLATSKPVQRALTGDSRFQQELKKWLDEAKAKGMDPGNVLTTARRGTVAEYGEE